MGKRPRVAARGAPSAWGSGAAQRELPRSRTAPPGLAAPLPPRGAGRRSGSPAGLKSARPPPPPPGRGRAGPAGNPAPGSARRAPRSLRCSAEPSRAEPGAGARPDGTGQDGTDEARRLCRVAQPRGTAPPVGRPRRGGTSVFDFLFFFLAKERSSRFMLIVLWGAAAGGGGEEPF